VNENQIVFVYVKEVMSPMPKSLQEAKGLITADYQNYLEKEWIEVLKKKYDYHVNEGVLDSLGSN
jgi:peptidyl-prolyl cis-trans isomerase SurA